MCKQVTHAKYYKKKILATLAHAWKAGAFSNQFYLSLKHPPNACIDNMNAENKLAVK